MLPETTQPPASTNKLTGDDLHRSETRLWIIFPFLLGILLIVVVFLFFALPDDPLWRTRSQAVADWLYSILCLLPLILCQFPVFMLVLVGIYGMAKFHAMAEPPLRKVELYAERFLNWLEALDDTVHNQVENIHEKAAPYVDMMTAFDAIGDDEEQDTHEPRE